MKLVLVIVEDLLHYESVLQSFFNEVVDVELWVLVLLPDHQEHRPKVSHLSGKESEKQ